MHWRSVSKSINYLGHGCWIIDYISGDQIVTLKVMQACPQQININNVFLVKTAWLMWHMRNSLRICIYVVLVCFFSLSVLPPPIPPLFQQKWWSSISLLCAVYCGKKNFLNTWGLLRLSALSNQAWKPCYCISCSYLLDVQSNFVICVEFYFALILCDFNIW